MNFLGYCGVDDDGYFNALILMFEQALKAIQGLDVKQQSSFLNDSKFFSTKDITGVSGMK